MFNRPMLFVGVLVAAVVVPYLLLDEHLAQAARAGWNGLLGKAQEENEALRAELAAGAAGHSATPIPPPTPIEQVFRFDLAPQWVTTRWPSASTVAGDPSQLGMRVALVSGTRPDDVAGSLTYYFDEHHQLQRITFTGLTGDPRRLLTAVVTPYGLKSQPTTDAAHYIAGDPKQPTSEVIARHASSVAGGRQATRTEVFVDLRRADAVDWREKAQSEPEVKILSSGFRRW